VTARTHNIFNTLHPANADLAARLEETRQALSQKLRELREDAENDTLLALIPCAYLPQEPLQRQMLDVLFNFRKNVAAGAPGDVDCLTACISGTYGAFAMVAVTTGGQNMLRRLAGLGHDADTPAKYESCMEKNFSQEWRMEKQDTSDLLEKAEAFMAAISIALPKLSRQFRMGMDGVTYWTVNDSWRKPGAAADNAKALPKKQNRHDLN